MAVLKAYFWKSSSLFTHPRVLPADLTHVAPGAADAFPLPQLKRLPALWVSRSEVKLTVASFLSDRIVDEILDALSHSHHKLVSALPPSSSTSRLCLRERRAPSARRVGPFLCFGSFRGEDPSSPPSISASLRGSILDALQREFREGRSSSP